MRWNATVLTLTLGLGVLLMLSGCQWAPATARASGPEETTVRVLMNEWSMVPSVASVPAGEVTFEVVNQGALEHELVVLKTDLALDALTLRASGDKVDEDASGTNMGEIEEIAAGETKIGTFTLTPGQYALVCNTAGHYTAGMVVAFEVK